MYDEDSDCNSDLDAGEFEQNAVVISLGFMYDPEEVSVVMFQRFSFGCDISSQKYHWGAVVGS
jgi:hypothetical protein